MWQGKVSAGNVLALVEQLNFNPYSRVRMIELGGDPRWIGWDNAAEATAATHDLILSVAHGIGGEKPDPGDFYPRPGGAKTSEMPEQSGLFAPTIDDFDPAAFMRVINGQ